MKHEEIYNNIRTTVGILLLTVMFMTPSCEDNVVEEQVSLEPMMQLWVNGDYIDPYTYYAQINTYGEKTLGEDGKIKKLFVKVLLVIRSISPSFVRKILLIIPSEKISFCFKLLILYSFISN